MCSLHSRRWVGRLCFIFFFQAGVFISIIWNSEWEIYLLLSLYLAFHSILFNSMDIWVYILYLRLLSNTTTFLLLLRLFQLCLKGLLYSFAIPLFFEQRFTLWTKRCSRLISYFPSLVLKSAISLKCSGSFCGRMVLDTKGMRCVQCYWCVLVFKASKMTQQGHMCVYTSLSIYDSK